MKAILIIFFILFFAKQSKAQITNDILYDLLIQFMDVSRQNDYALMIQIQDVSNKLDSLGKSFRTITGDSSVQIVQLPDSNFVIRNDSASHIYAGNLTPYKNEIINNLQLTVLKLQQQIEAIKVELSKLQQ